MNHVHLHKDHKPHHASKEPTSESTPLIEPKTRTASIGYQYQEGPHNFPYPEHMKLQRPEYLDPKAADLAQRASLAGREDLRAMLDHFVYQMEEAQKNYDPALVFGQM